MEYNPSIGILGSKSCYAEPTRFETAALGNRSKKKFILQVDASNRGLGAILSQEDQEGEEHPIAYASRKLQPREQKLFTTEKEYLGIVWAVELFRYYLYGRTFKLQTDHNPLVWLNQVRDKSR